MADHSKIEWTDATWNPMTGCTKVSPGCDHCYAERIVERFKGKGAFAEVRLNEERLEAPLRWRRPRMVFVNSMSDLFHDVVPDEYIARVWAVMHQTPRHAYQILTKRHGRMRSLLNSPEFIEQVQQAIDTLHDDPDDQLLREPWPPTNVWLGVSVEDQKWADIRIPALLETPAAVRWLSCEPLLGPISLQRLRPHVCPPDRPCPRYIHRIDWVVVGGESGPGARPMQPDWARSLRDQCTAAEVPFFFKQWGAWAAPSQLPDDTFMRWDVEHGTGAYDRDRPWRFSKKAAGRELDGRTWDEYPSAVGVMAGG